MANNQMINFNSQDVANMYRRNQLANALQERMNAPTPVHTYQGFQAPISPLTGLTKALDAYSVFQNEKNQEDRYQAEKVAAEQKAQNLINTQNQQATEFRNKFNPVVSEEMIGGNTSFTPTQYADAINAYGKPQEPTQASDMLNGEPTTYGRKEGTLQTTSTPRTREEMMRFESEGAGSNNPQINRIAENSRQSRVADETAKAVIDKALVDMGYKTDADKIKNNSEVEAATIKFKRDKILKEMDVNRPQKPMTAKQEIQFSADINKSYSTAVTALSVLDEVSKSVKAVQTAPNLEGSTGLQSYLPSYPDSDASITDSRLENLKGKMTLLGKAASSASGAIGPMAIQEWKIVRDMVANIDPKKGKKSLLEQINLVEDQIAGSAQRIREFYDNQYSDYFEKYPKLSSLEIKEFPLNVDKTTKKPDINEPTKLENVIYGTRKNGQKVIKYPDGRIVDVN